jgi:murein DD-endopeptidase MepM/ murein hydrolase activator NlpD
MSKRIRPKSGGVKRKRPVLGAIVTLVCLDVVLSVAAFPLVFGAATLSQDVESVARPVTTIPALGGKAVDQLKTTLSAVSGPAEAPLAGSEEQKEQTLTVSSVEEESPPPILSSVANRVAMTTMLLPEMQPQEQPLQSLLLRTPVQLDPDEILPSDYEVPKADESTPPTVSLPPTADCETGASPLYCVYTVAQGDTLTRIAEKFEIQGSEDVAPWQLLVQSNKPELVGEGDQLIVGQRLRIPLQTGVLHVVEREESLRDVSLRFGVPIDQIKEISANGLTEAADDEALVIGRQLVIPSPTRFTVSAEGIPIPSTAPSGTAPDSSGPLQANASPTAEPSTASGSGPSTNANATQDSQPSGLGFIWPATGNISSYYGANHPLGIDIDFYNDPNQPVSAAGSGTVIFAGGDPCCSYGYYVIVDHGNGVETLYGHLSQISVYVGQAVGQGELLGYGGRTGYATGNHLHFEVRINGYYVNPLAYLP